VVISIVVFLYLNRPISIEILTELQAFNYGTAAAYSVRSILVIAVALGPGERFQTTRNTMSAP